MSCSQGDTIAAISTPAGEGAIALVRVSGEGALALADKLVRAKEAPSRFASHVQHLAELVENGETVDQVMVSVHRAPQSYTGEDLVEISCHGGVLVTARVLQACLRAGARAAEAGEFTERAFRQGKMDLTQAEAVIEMIRAKTDLALRSATEQLQGRLGERIGALRDELVTLLAQIEAAIDFPDEGVAPETPPELAERLARARARLAELLSTAEPGRLLREGVRVVIYGATNAGKSSLLNRLLGYERAIVSEIHGTTRDTIEEVISLRGIPVRLLDTAGLRHSEDRLEQAGIERTERALATADLILHVVDASEAMPRDFQAARGETRTLLLLNKKDRPEHPDWRETAALRISCVTTDGLAGLDDEILTAIGAGQLQAENAVAINLRHRACLERAGESCARAAATLAEGRSLEYLAVDLRAGLRAVEEVVGASSDDAILDSVFAQFCVGK